MDEEFGSFVVTDPDIVDPSIDVSGLRTQTDTSLLGNIPDYAGIQYEAFNPNRLSDLMRLYSSGLPAIDTPAAAPPATGGGGSGDGGQATTPVDTTPIDTSIIDEGIQSAEDDKGDVMLEDFEMANMGGITSDPIQMENIASNPYDIPMNIDDPGASIENLAALNPSGTIGGAPDVFDIDKTGDPTTTMLDVPTDTVGLAYTGEFDPNDEGTVFDTSITPEDTEQSITQKVADFLGVDASKINKAAVTGALNLVAGKALDTVIPIATVFNLVKDSFTKSQETSVDDFDTTPITTDITSDLIDEVALTGGQPETGVNPFADIDTGVGEFDTTPVNTTPVDTTVTGTLGPPSEISGPQITEEKPVDTKLADDRAVDELSYDQIIEYENLTNKLEGEEIQKTGNPDITLSKQEEIKNKAIDQIKEKDVDEFSDEAFMVGDTSTAAPTGGDSGADSFFDAVDKSVTGTTKPGTKTEPTYQDAIMRGQTGGGSDSGGSSNGGGKIVCTMMNESYGFGSFRNKIWMKFHKDLSPEYQRGYHKLFLPLVKIAKKNMVVKKILEHIAVHSTIDMRQSMRGKTHLLGRIYRKILLPLCYWVGKNG